MIELNPKLSDHRLMIDSGARSSKSHLRQLCTFNGLVEFDNEIHPTTFSFKEGMNLTSLLLISYGTRDSNISKNLRTADSGFLNRQMVTIANNIVITKEDCKTEKFLVVNSVDYDNIQDFTERVFGHTLAADFVHKNNVLLIKNTILVKESFLLIKKLFLSKKEKIKLNLRSVLYCECERDYELCAMCYGADLSNWGKINVGENVGITSAQALTERTMQLTLSKIHGGGVLSFEQRFEKITAKQNGIVSFDEELHIMNSQLLKDIT